MQVFARRNHKRKLWIGILILIWILTNVYILSLEWNSQERFSENLSEWGFRQRCIIDQNGLERSYAIFVPRHREPKERMPVILFLHGSGQRGTNGIDPLMSGLGPAVWKRKEKFPFLLIFPHCHPELNWDAAGTEAAVALKILDEISQEFPIDAHRIYLTGFSMGGAGTWSIGLAHPKKFAALAPICGDVDMKFAEKLADLKLPVWGFCGELDSPQTVNAMRRIHQELEPLGAESKYTEYPGVGHNCWDLAYDTDELYDWLLQKQHPSSK